VRFIFGRFLELGAIGDLAADLEGRGVRSKLFISRKGKSRGGVVMSPGGVAHLLDNPVYCGMIRHRGVLHPGQHPPIVDTELWDAIQALRSQTRGKGRATAMKSGAKLIGKVFDAHANPMSPTTTRKGAVKYRYYMTRAQNRKGDRDPIQRVPMTALEDVAAAEIAPRLQSGWRSDLISPQERALGAIKRIEIGASELMLHVAADALGGSAEETVCMTCAVGFARARNSTTIIRKGAPIAPHVDRALVRALAIARAWMKRLDAGDPGSIKQLASREGLCILHTAKLLPLAFLAPDLVEQMLEGRQPRTLTQTALIAETLPLDWNAQRQLFARFA
jgi:hypothetical protein